MRAMIEKLAAFGCSSQSSIAVIDNNQPKKPRHEFIINPPPPPPPPPPSQLQIQSNVKKSNSFGIQKVIIKGIKSFTNLFQFHRDNDDEDDVDVDDDDEIEMVIGLPTDVQHVAHIGWDGFSSGDTSSIIKSSSNNNNNNNFWDKRGSDLLSLPSIALQQFELAIVAQVEGPH